MFALSRSQVGNKHQGGGWPCHFMHLFPLPGMQVGGFVEGKDEEGVEW
jgi:hypothetical protein